MKRSRDYLQSVGKGWRIASAAACTLAAAIFSLFFGVLCANVFGQQGFHKDNIGLPAALGIMALLAFFSACLSWRLWQSSVSGNGVTSMPTWFITAFGFCFLAGSTAVALTGGSKLLFARSIGIGLAMIFIGRNIARRKNARIAESRRGRFLKRDGDAQRQADVPPQRP